LQNLQQQVGRCRGPREKKLLHFRFPTPFFKLAQ
jgi:hypothetical protein